MNHLGLLFAWTAAQLTLFLIPAFLVHWWASRRGPALGAWAAALGLALCLLLPFAGMVPLMSAFPWNNHAQALPASSRSIGRNFEGEPSDSSLGYNLAPLAARWNRFRSGLAAAVSPAKDDVPVGGCVAIVALLGVGLGLSRLLLGLWAVRLYRRCCRPVTDAALIGLLDELRLALSVDRTVNLLASTELGTPATAGWRRPAILLTDDWQNWDDATRRAVLAHELAHIARADYATGLIARLATAIHFYHPLIHSMAQRLQLQQELAADAIAMRLGGGRVAYLLALSRLALRQDGWLPCWPARAFLPPRGALIRRIATLQNESMTTDRTRQAAHRWLIASGLLALALGAAMLRGPARADEKVVNTTPEAATPAPQGADWLYAPEKSDGLVMLRPAAAFRRLGRPGLSSLASRTIGLELAAAILAESGLDPEFLLQEFAHPSLNFADIECVTAGFKLGIGKTRQQNGEVQKLHSILASGAMIRTIAPFDWLALFRKWGVECSEVRVKRGVCYELKSPVTSRLGIQPCIYLPDDRTIVLDRKQAIEKLAQRDKPELPAYAAVKEWKAATRGLLAIAYCKPDDFEMTYNLGRPDDAVVMSLLHGVNTVIFSAADGDQIALRAVADCTSAGAPKKIASVVQSLNDQGIKAVEAFEVDLAPLPMQLDGVRLLKGLLGSMRVQAHPGSLTVESRGFGSFAEFASVIEAELKVYATQMDKEIAQTRKDDGRKPTR